MISDTNNIVCCLKQNLARGVKSKCCLLINFLLLSFFELIVGEVIAKIPIRKGAQVDPVAGPGGREERARGAQVDPVAGIGRGPAAATPILPAELGL